MTRKGAIKNNIYEEIKAIYEKLCENRSYWEIDNDYKHKFRIVEDGVNNWENISLETKPYILDVARFLEESDKRLFFSVVRCRDCEYYTPSPHTFGFGECGIHASETARHRVCQEVDFCSWGERRES